MAIVAVAAGVSAMLLRSAGHHVWALVAVIAAGVVLLVLFAGNEKLARPVLFILRPGIWIVRKLMDALELLGFYRG